ncbi:MAG: arginine--tRNA ligase [Alphaproteobacteria bacterium]
MNVFNYLKAIIDTELQGMAAAGALPVGLDLTRVSVDPPRDASHGDAATNAAMVLARPAGKNPRELAGALAARLSAHPDIVSAEPAGPGFVNLRLADAFWRARIKDILEAGIAFGDSTIGGGEKVNVEYVSANPTGPMHVGHARGAVFGDVLAALLAKAGWKVTREYYINDAGGQVDALGRSVYHRYRRLLGEDPGELPPGMYPGDYLIPVAEKMLERNGAVWRQVPESQWLPVFRDMAVSDMMLKIREDLEALGIEHDAVTAERGIVQTGGVDWAMEQLDKRGLLYTGVLEPPKGKLPDDWEERPQLLFRSSQFGDDVDRPVQKSDGSWTYFAADIAYHVDKVRRGFNAMIDVWGADHGGYVKRMTAAVTALSDGKATLDVRLCQLVRLLEDGEPAKMSKRAGNFVSLADLVERVGRDVVRFIMLTRKNDAQLDFDLVAVTQQSRDNPVFYVQYAHARCRSVERAAAEAFPDADLSPAGLAARPLDRLDDPDEMALAGLLAQWPRTVEAAALAHEPHRLAFYLYDVAAGFHALWSKARGDASLRFLVPADRDLSLARLALVGAVRTVIASGLAVMGVQPVEELRE